MIYLWRGQHSETLLAQLEKSLENNDLFILCPPVPVDFGFILNLPRAKVSVLGEFSSEEIAKIRDFENLAAKTREAMAYPTVPLVGVFTSGTMSGTPRLVLYSRSNIEAALRGILSFFDENKIENVFSYPPPFHTFGLVLGYLHSILYGRKLSIQDGRYGKSAHVARAGIKEYATLTLGTPSHFYDLIQYVKAEKIELAPTYSCIIGGAKVSVALWKEIQSILHIESPSVGYGATEACPGITHVPPGQVPKVEGEIGYALRGIDIWLHAGQGLEFKGPSLCLAIIEKGHITFPSSVLIHDLVERRKDDGIYVFQGRKGLILNRGGTKYSLEHLEQLFRTELGLNTCCATVPDIRLVDDLAVIVEKKDGLSPSEAKAQCVELLYRHYGHRFALQIFQMVDALPLSANAKLDRKRAEALIRPV